ncbi:MAG: hypothetical protein ACQEWM_05110 [Actinomycetota bacterium]
MVERTGPFASVMVVLEPSALVLGIAVGVAVGVIACTSLTRVAPEVAHAVRTLALAAIVVLTVAALVGGYLWIRSFSPGAPGWEALALGDVAVPWPLTASVRVTAW